MRRGRQECASAARTKAWSRGARVLLLLIVICAGPSVSCRNGASAPAAPARATGSNAPAPAPPGTYGFRKAERTAVGQFLRRHPDLRLPKESDRRVSAGGEGDVRKLYGIYNPYFVRGDLNDDGVLDFVLAFVRTHGEGGAGTPWFTIVVFTGRESASSGLEFGSETFLERDISLAAGDLAIDRDAILITPDLEDETTRRYRWDPARRAYVFVRDDPSETRAPELSQT